MMTETLTDLVPNVDMPHRRSFDAGKSGNNSGRTKGFRNKVVIAMEALLEGEYDTITHKLIEKAKGGHMPSLRLCLKRLSPARRDRPVKIELPSIHANHALQASSAVLSGCANGLLSP